ncbi:MAG TPA: DISARM system SNF2-like helicase DrmD [Caldilineaceae bacterium]|nr:DISARM system SNF2-like helicase DrmD [Caldilineaceae bacterium]
MTQTHLSAIPEQGQLVQVRGRTFVVANVQASALPPPTLAPTPSRPQHLISLTSTEDDALGETLEVIWEIEPSTRLIEGANLPPHTGFDAPDRLDAFLNAVRWRAASNADVRTLQAPFRSGIDIEDYQLDPLVRALQMPRVNLLIADDVGLGKTIEAGMVIQELIIRQRARRILIVCPASLQVQWQEQMRDKFGLAFHIVNSELMRDLRRRRGIHVNPWTHFPRLITSIDYLKRDRPLRLFRETLPGPDDPTYPRRYDLLLIDEAHNIAPSGSGQYAIDSQRTEAIRLLAPHFEHKLFLTATPHNGYAESFSALLELLDNQRFARGIAPEQEVLQRIMVRRLKSELPPDTFGKPRFPARKLVAIAVGYSSTERQAHAWLQRYTTLRQQAAHDNQERTAITFVLKLLKKRLFSSPAAFARTVRKHQQSLTHATKQTTVRKSSSSNEGILRARLNALEDAYADDIAFEESIDEALHTVSRLFTPLSPQEATLLQQLIDWATDAANRPDSKAAELIRWLHATVRPEGQWTEERVIIFTEYRDTQNWLHQLLAAEGLTGHERLMVLHGGLNSQERERIKAAFQAAPAVSPVRILLATDAASEGIDLQLHCHRLIHYEIPWNPNRMEQRNGRIDRHGQRHNPLIFHFIPALDGGQTDDRQAEADTTLPPLVEDTLFDFTAERDSLDWDMEFLLLAVRKVEQIREDLGKVGPVIADQVTEAMLGRRDRLQTLDAEAAGRQVRRLFRFEQDLRARIESLMEQLKEAERTLVLSPENVQRVVEIGLQLAGQPPLREATLDGIWPDPSGRRTRCPVFDLPALQDSWAACTEGLLHPHTGTRRPIVFDRALARRRDDVVLAHLNHRLVQMCLRLLRAEVWNLGPTAGLARGGQGLHRVTARVAPDHRCPELAVIIHARLVVIGGDSQRLHEELIFAGGQVRQGVFRRFDALYQIEELLAAATDEAAPPQIEQDIAEFWPNVRQNLRRSLEVRQEERTNSLVRRLEERQEKELTDIRAILNELAGSIRRELHNEPEQLSLFNLEERQQYARNVSALEARLAQIPAEIAAEEEVIRRRYADPQPRLFPVAVTWIVPARLT